MSDLKLRPLDLFSSYKEVELKWYPPWVPIEYLMDRGIKHFGEQIYPGGKTDVNHVRIFVGYFDGVPVAFEWTYPIARFVEVEDWMLDYNYCRILRQTEEHTATDWFIQEKLIRLLQEFEGSKYDWLQPVGIITNMKWVQFSEHRKVCSPGARYVQEKILNISNLFPEVADWRTPPCSWGNNKEKFYCINEPKSRKRLPILSEPVQLQQVILEGKTHVSH